MSDSAEGPSSSDNSTDSPPPLTTSELRDADSPSNDEGNSPPSPPPTKLDSPPPPKQSSPPPPSSPSPPPPSPPISKDSESPNDSETAPPPPETKKSPPPPSSRSPPPPPSSKKDSSPSPSDDNDAESPPPPPTSEEFVSPPPPEDTQKSPPPPAELNTPPAPPLSDSSSPLSPPPSTKSGPASSPVSGDSTTNRSSAASPTTKNSTSSSPTTATGGEETTTTTKAVAGSVLAGMVLLTIIAIFFVVKRRKKRRDPYGGHYMPPPSNFTVKTDGYYYGQHPQSMAMGFSNVANNSSGSQTSNIGDSFVAQKGNMYNGPESGIFAGSKSFFSYEELMEITEGFSRENIIGEGGFGCVYKGILPDGKVVAVKQLKAGSGQGDREFKAEVEIISRVHHRHLVSLVGYSTTDNHRILIYEFVPNDTLEHHLHSKGLPLLDWPKRLKIAIGSAKGLAYLHEDCHPKIIHRDIKSANILLDDAFEAKVADFGLARLNDSATQTHVSTRVMGTFGYLAPEYASSGKLTDRSDVYSFGVVLLELITGRKPIDPTQPLGDESLVEWARPLLLRALETGNLSEIIDPRLGKQYVESEVLRMVETAAACVRHSGPKRPRMMQVVRALDSDSDMSDLSNGVKYGQSTAYDSGQYNQDIMRFKRMVQGDDSSEFQESSGEYTSRDITRGTPISSEFNSGELETQAMNQPGNRSTRRYV